MPVYRSVDVWLRAARSGAMLVALADGRFCGSLSGGCVEDDFLERLGRNEFGPDNQVVRYGEGGLAPSLKLPCGGVLDVLVEQFVPGCEALEHFSLMLQALQGQQRIIRAVSLDTLNRTLDICSAQGSTVEVSERQIAIRIGAARRLLIAGLSPVAEFCASFAVSLGYEVIVCDPRTELLAGFALEGVKVIEQLPATFIANGGCHASTAVVALTHDPRLTT